MVESFAAHGSRQAGRPRAGQGDRSVASQARVPSEQALENVLWSAWSRSDSGFVLPSESQRKEWIAKRKSSCPLRARRSGWSSGGERGKLVIPFVMLATPSA